MLHLETTAYPGLRQYSHLQNALERRALACSVLPLISP
jgi:hypothetical protein